MRTHYFNKRSYCSEKEPWSKKIGRLPSAKEFVNEDMDLGRFNYYLTKLEHSSNLLNSREIELVKKATSENGFDSRSLMTRQWIMLAPAAFCFFLTGFRTTAVYGSLAEIFIINEWMDDVGLYKDIVEMGRRID